MTLEISGLETFKNYKITGKLQGVDAPPFFLNLWIRFFRFLSQNIGRKFRRIEWINPFIRFGLKNAPVAPYPNPHPKVYLSLTCSPERLNNLSGIFEVLDLNHVEAIFLNLPKVFGRTGQTYDWERVRKIHPKIRLQVLDQDLGPISKILPAWKTLQIEDPNAVVISIDDDTVYPRGMVSAFLNAHQEMPDAVLGSAGSSYQKFGIQYPEEESHPVLTRGRIKYQFVPIIEGFGAVLYPVSRIPVSDIEECYSTSPETFTHDDLVISYCLQKNHIPRYQICCDSFHRQWVTQYACGFSSNAIGKGAGVENFNRKTKNEKVFQDLQRAWKA